MDNLTEQTPVQKPPSQSKKQQSFFPVLLLFAGIGEGIILLFFLFPFLLPLMTLNASLHTSDMKFLIAEGLFGLISVSCLVQILMAIVFLVKKSSTTDSYERLVGKVLAIGVAIFIIAGAFGLFLSFSSIISLPTSIH